MLAAGGSVQAQQWPDAPAEARPGTRWWWLGSAVDEKNLTYISKNTPVPAWAP